MTRIKCLKIFNDIENFSTVEFVNAIPISFDRLTGRTKEKNRQRGRR